MTTDNSSRLKERPDRPLMEETIERVNAIGGDIETAKASAKNQAKRIARAKKAVEITMPGNTAIVAGMHVNLAEFRSGISGRYKVVTVRHSLSRSGFTTTITGEAA